MYSAQKQVQALACSACSLEATSWDPRYHHLAAFLFCPQQVLNPEWMDVSPVHVASALRTLFAEFKCALLSVLEH